MKDSNGNDWQADHRDAIRLNEIDFFFRQQERGEAVLGVYLEGLNLRLARSAGGEFKVVVKGVSEVGVKLVAFRSGDTAIAVVHKALKEWWNGTLNWREDEWAKSND